MNTPVAELVEELARKTRAGAALWVRESRPREFALYLDTATLVLDRWPDPEQGELVQLALYSPDGERIDEVILSRDGDPAAEFEALAGLYEMVRRAVHGVDGAVAAVLAELREKDTVGREPDRSDSVDFDDVLPF